MILGEIPFRQVTRLARLIVQTVVGLRRVTDVGSFAVVESVVQTPVVTVLEKWPRDDC